MCFVCFFFSKVCLWFVCCYLSFVVYTCNSLTRLGKHNKHKREHKRQQTNLREQTTNKYRTSSRPLDHEELSLRFWLDELYLCCVVFSKVVCCLFVCCYLSFVAYTCKRLTRLGKHKTVKRKTNNLREKQQHKIQLIQPEPERYLVAVGWWAGGCTIFCVCLIFSKVSVCFFCFVCFCLVLLSFACISETIQVTTKTTTFDKPTHNNNKHTAHPAAT